MKCKINPLGVRILVAVVMTLLFGLSGVQAAEKKHSLKLQIFLGPNHPITKVVHEAYTKLEKMTNNRLKIRIYDSNVLAGQREILQATGKGVVDIGLWYPMPYSKTIPLINMTGGLPLAYSNKATCIDSWKGTGMCELLEEAVVEKGYENVGIGYPHHTAFFGLGFSKNEVRVPSDMKGSTIMVRGGSAIKFVESYGAAAISSISTGEVYEALTRGIIDGAWCTSTNLTNMKWMEPMKYYVNLPFCGIHMFWIWNKKKMNALPEDLRNIVFNFLDHSSDKIMITYFKYRESYLPVVAENMKVYTPTPAEVKIWREKRDEILDDFVKIAGERGAKAVEIINKFNK